MTENRAFETAWDDNPIDITQEANFIWSIANSCAAHICPINTVMS